MFDQIFFSPQAKKSVIISNKHSTYELPHQLPNDLRFRILILEISGKSQKFIEQLPSAQFSSQKENFVSPEKQKLSFFL